jgi:hypothetical protein
MDFEDKKSDATLDEMIFTMNEKHTHTQGLEEDVNPDNR